MVMASAKDVLFVNAPMLAAFVAATAAAPALLATKLQGSEKGSSSSSMGPVPKPPIGIEDIGWAPLAVSLRQQDDGFVLGSVALGESVPEAQQNLSELRILDSSGVATSYIDSVKSAIPGAEQLPAVVQTDIKVEYAQV